MVYKNLRVFIKSVSLSFIGIELCEKSYRTQRLTYKTDTKYSVESKS